LPQGSSKKIQFYLLLADLALELADPLARRRKILRRLKIKQSLALARPTRRPKGLGPASPEVPVPLIEKTARHPQFTRQV
jgi:hypothetical protein